MAFQRLNIRAKKSFPGLYSFENADSCLSSKSTAAQYESPPRADFPKDVEDCNLEDFGATLERCKGSPGKDSPSKRKKLLGSLRSLRSLANLHSSPSKTKQIETPCTQSPSTRRDPSVTPLALSPSLALLNFQQSPLDQPMFELNMHERSMSGSSLEVLHSSPMTVPGSARQMTPYNVPPPTDLPAGTIPDTPGPMQRAFNRDPANHVPWQIASPTPLERYAPSTPVLTPLPGTNLTVGDLDPELVPLPPSINSSVAQIGQGNSGYFDIPVEEQPAMDNADMLNGLACLKLAEDHGDAGDSGTKASHDSGPHTPVGRCGNSEEMGREYKDAKLQDTVSTQGYLKDQALELRRKQQAKELSDTVRAPNVPQHHQVLPLRPKQQGEDLQDRVRKDSVISKDWETGSGERSTGSMSEHTHAHRTPSQSYETNLPADSTAPASSEHCKRMEARSSPPADFAYIVWDSPNESGRNAAQENTWGRHTGLYDGSGYGHDASGPATSCESNEGTKDVHIESGSRSIEPSMAALSVDGDHSGKDISNRPSRGEDPYPEYVRRSPLTVHEQRNYESLESIYHAYAYPFGERVSSSSNNSIGGDVQQPATKETEISS